jgi:hypothetical protein
MDNLLMRSAAPLQHLFQLGDIATIIYKVQYLIISVSYRHIQHILFTPFILDILLLQPLRLLIRADFMQFQRRLVPPTLNLPLLGGAYKVYNFRPGGKKWTNGNSTPESRKRRFSGK